MITKLSNGAQYCNSKLPKEFAEYLVQNGFQTISIKDGICFHKDKTVKLFVKNDCIDLFRFNPELEGNQWPFYQSHAGFSHLNLFGWIMLMHIMGVLTINQFLKNAEKVDHQMATEANAIIQNVFRFQLPNKALSA